MPLVKDRDFGYGALVLVGWVGGGVLVSESKVWVLFEVKSMSVSPK